MTELEPIKPEYALELYLQEKETDCTESTVYAHKSRLGHFLRWCDEEEIENLNHLTGRKLHEYRLWRQEDGDLTKVTAGWRVLMLLSKTYRRKFFHQKSPPRRIHVT